MKFIVPLSYVPLRTAVGAFMLIAVMSCPCFAVDESKQYVRVTNTQHVDFAVNGTVHVTHSLDELTIEGWDQPGVEITTIESTWRKYGASQHDQATHELDRVKVTAEQQGGELVIATLHPRTHPVTMVYSIKVPRNAHVIVDGQGEVHFDAMAGDIEANMHGGTITVRLANDAQYSVDAHTKLGSVISDFPGATKRHGVVGHDFTASGPAPHKLVLKEGFGDIVIMKAAAPVMPASKS